MKIAAVILAAGASSRFEDGHKLLALIDGVPMIRRVATAVAASNVSELIVVTNAADDRVPAAVGQGRWKLIANPQSRNGLSSSLRLGLTAISDAEGAMIVLGDMPGLTSELLSKLLAEFENTNGEKIVFPVLEKGTRGHPVIWPRAAFDRLKLITGDKGGRQLLDELHDLWHPVAVTGQGAFIDIDTLADLAAFVSETAQPTRRK